MEADIFNKFIYKNKHDQCVRPLGSSIVSTEATLKRYRLNESSHAFFGALRYSMLYFVCYIY